MLQYYFQESVFYEGKASEPPGCLEQLGGAYALRYGLGFGLHSKALGV